MSSGTGFIRDDILSESDSKILEIQDVIRDPIVGYLIVLQSNYVVRKFFEGKIAWKKVHKTTSGTPAYPFIFRTFAGI